MGISRLRVLAVSSLVPFTLLACSGSEDEEPSTETDPCDAENRVEGSLCVETIGGLVVDEQDQPVPQLQVTVCGPICFQGTTDESGAFTVELNEYLLTSEYSVQPHGTPTASTFYYRIDPSFDGGDYDAGTLRVVELEDDGALMETKIDLIGQEPPAPSQSWTSGSVTVSVEEGTVIRLAPADALEGDEGRSFRSRELSDELAAEFAPGLSDARVFALGPFEADFQNDEGEVEVSLAVENSEDLQPGAEVEVLALGTYKDTDWLSPAQFETIGTATVSADGSFIELPAGAAGAGLLHLTWIALVAN